MMDLLNKEIPINIKYNEDLVDRVHSRYPFISKIEVSLIVKSVFQSFRDLLVLGNILNFHNLFFDTKLYFFDYNYKGTNVPGVKLKLTTPPKLRKVK